MRAAFGLDYRDCPISSEDMNTRALGLSKRKVHLGLAEVPNQFGARLRLCRPGFTGIHLAGRQP
jgi:hypothetical protein